MKTSIAEYILVLLAIISIVFVSCQKSEESNYYSWVERWTVASETVIGQGEGPIECYWIKRNDSPIWIMQDANVEGFEYEEGYEYVIDIIASRIPDPPQDASSLSWKLKEIISKIRKNSENLPQVYKNHEDFIANSTTSLSEIKKAVKRK